MTPQDRLDDCTADVAACPDIAQWIKDYLQNVKTYVGGTNPTKPYPIKPA